MEALLSQLRKRDHKKGPTPYLDKLLAAFQQENKPNRAADKPAKADRVLEILESARTGGLAVASTGPIQPGNCPTTGDNHRYRQTPCQPYLL